MKVKFKYGIASFSGTIESAVYYATPGGQASFMRKYVVPKPTTQNTTLGTNAKNLALFWEGVSAGYKQEAKTYASLYFQQNQTPGDDFQVVLSNFSTFIKMMYSFAEANVGTVTLDSVTYNDVVSLFSEITTIAGAIDEGFLPNVIGGDALTTAM